MLTTTQPASATALAPRQWTLRDYAFVADGERGALIDPEGVVAWLCFPNWDSDPIFDALVGGSGYYQVSPRARFVWGGHYEPGSLIWRSRWVTPDAVVECREALMLGGGAEHAVLLRRLEAVAGTAPMRIELKPDGPERGAACDLRRDTDSTWTGRIGDVHLRWWGGPDATVEPGPTLAADVVIAPGHAMDLVLELSTRPFGEPPDAAHLWRSVECGWSERLPHLNGVVAARDALHARAVLHGMTSQASGIVAAATTSLPERVPADRDYDYRFVWIRDECYAGLAGAAAGDHMLLDAAARFVQERLLSDGASLRPVYRADGTAIGDSPLRLELPGYPGTGAVIRGNRAAQQFQLDCFGEALLLFAAAAVVDRLSIDGWRAAEVAATAIEARWHEPDWGVWEDGRRHWTSSRLVCAAGLRRMARVARRAPQVARWEALAERLVAVAMIDGVNTAAGRWCRAPDDPRVDASLLVPQFRGLLPPMDPYACATRRAVASELTAEGYVYRFAPASGRLGSDEGAFLVCSYWLALAELDAGNHARAMEMFERARSACGPPGLFAEEFDVEQRQLRGNLPQAFVHALMLETAARLGAARR